MNEATKAGADAAEIVRDAMLQLQLVATAIGGCGAGSEFSNEELAAFLWAMRDLLARALAMKL